MRTKYIVKIYDVDKNDPPYKFKTLGEIEVDLPDPQLDIGGVHKFQIIRQLLWNKFDRGLHFISYDEEGNGIAVACLTDDEYPLCMLGHFGCECMKRVQDDYE
jgi:hypothetical protein